MPPTVPKRLQSEVVGDHRIFRVLRHRVAYPGRHPGEEARPFEAFCLQISDWVTVAAFTTAGDALLVRQHRHGVDDLVLETPGGFLDAGESPADAAARELREETGYRVGRSESLGWVHPNPAIQDNRLHYVLALDVALEGERMLDEHEDTEPVLLPRAELWRMLRAGEIRHALSALCLERAFAALGEGTR
jgi:ADP-ribose pyrophosphatase YjhB (NUDIX family)